MTNMEATYIYRAKVKQAFTKYKQQLTAAHEAHGRAIPPTEASGRAMQRAWDRLVLRLRWAGQALNTHRSMINGQA